ncbi:extracellular solute-binding protein [Pseudokineococcus basanitobsidens]|uniref:Extracellular solute-binding protein n=1 Tax=Pseudokineococcus basanitobsidens TaxID=1926649 RepID=A0ABU8RID5_9ACTN
MDQTKTSRRSFLTMVAMAPVAAAAVSACGTSGPGSSGGGGGGGGGSAASMWYLSGEPNETIKNENIGSWNDANPDQTIDITFFQNDAYKTKIKTAIGAGQAPTMIYGWGGGILASYADADQVVDLTDWLDENPDVKNRVLDSTYGAATVDDRIYALPNENASPIIFYYNADIFQEQGVEPPATWDDLMSLVQTFNDAGIAPIALGGQSRWTSMMWLEYLYDRVGGPEVFNAIYAGEADAWSADGSIQALTMVQDLVKAGGFINGFESITADSNADIALMYTGRTAMMLHGSWTYAGMKGDGGDFVPSGTLQWIDFPSVEGGAGDPKNVVGNPAQYMSISSEADDAAQEAAKAYFADTENGIMSDSVIQAYIDSGQVCVATGIDDLIAASDDKDFLNFAYGLVRDAPNFQQSWDQAVSPATAETLLTNIDQLFALSITPQQFADSMNQTLGQ